MKQVCVILCLSLLVGCSSKVIPLKGNYFNPPYQIKSANSFDETWSKLIDVFAQKGLPIKIIDRSSGLIVAGSSLMKWTTEKKDGTLVDPNAPIVTSLVYNWGQNKYIAPVVTGNMTCDWNVRIKPDGGGSIININITSTPVYIDPMNGKSTPITIRSTGAFEKALSEVISTP